MMERHSLVSISTVIPLIRQHINTFGKVRVGLNGQDISVSGLRLQTFAKENGLVCSCCGLQASHFALERSLPLERVDMPFHLNLYGEKDGEEILFTHDHTLARCLGGENTLENTTTMCIECNQIKGRKEQMASIFLKEMLLPKEIAFFIDEEFSSLKDVTRKYLEL